MAHRGSPCPPPPPPTPRVCAICQCHPFLLQRSIESGDLSGEVVLLTGAVKMTPEDLRLWVTRASALRRLGHFADAMSDLDEASAR